MNAQVLMLSYDCLALTREAIRSVLEQDIPVDLTVFDDGSTDGSIEYIRSLYPRVSLITYRHKGTSYLWNRGLWHLFGMGAERVLIVNNDTQLRPDTYRRLIADGGQFVTCVGSSDGHAFPGGEPSGERRPHPDFSCYMIRESCWDRIGPFDETMRFYCSDGDYHLRMHKAGIAAYCIQLPFLHHASGTLKNVSDEDRQRLLQQAQRDRETFRNKWGFEMGSEEYYQQFKGAFVCQPE